MRTGLVIGSTDRLAARAKDRPIDFQEVLATLYHNMGIHVAQSQLIDPSGRPQYLLDYREPIRELV